MNKVSVAETITINRQDLKNADYNPRKINEEERKRLKAGISKFGLVEFPVWNRRTGNIVGGHQRISILDQLERSSSYDLIVSVVDLSERDERALNVQLNSASMQGEFDLDKLADLVQSNNFSADELGLSNIDMEILDIPELDMSAFDDTEEVCHDKETLAKIKQDRTEATQRLKEEQSAGFYFTVICKDGDQRRTILRALKTPDYEEFVDGSFLESILKRAE